MTTLPRKPLEIEGGRFLCLFSLSLKTRRPRVNSEHWRQPSLHWQSKSALDWECT